LASTLRAAAKGMTPFCHTGRSGMSPSTCNS
jgi:hypothetical protein